MTPILILALAVILAVIFAVAHYFALPGLIALFAVVAGVCWWFKSGGDGSDEP